MSHAQKVLDVYSKKILILSLLFSFVGHTAVLSLTTFIEMNGKKMAGKSYEVINIDIQDAPVPKKKIQLPRIKQKPVNVSSPQGQNRDTGNMSPEDTVNLNVENSKYTPYLKKIKRKIEYTWHYPENAYKAGKEGVTVIRFSIDRSGALVAGKVMSSSGAGLLDQGVLDAVQAAAPYDPLPDDMRLSRLHIIATFHYILSK